MKNTIKKISNIKKGKLVKLVRIINVLVPNSIDEKTLLDWSQLPKDRLKVKLEIFFLNRQFSEKTLNEISKEIFRFPWKKVFYATFLVLILSISYLFYQFKMSPRLYCVGSKIDMTSSKPDPFSSSNQIGLDNIGILNGVLTTSKTTVLYENVQGDKYEVKEDNFIKWILGNQPTSLINAINFVKDKQSFSEYIKIFTPYIGLSDFEILSSADRKAIFNFIQKHSNIEMVGDDFHNYKCPDSSYHILGKMQLDGAPDITLIYIRFKLLNGNYNNYVLSHKSSLVSYIENGPTIPRYSSPDKNFLFYTLPNSDTPQVINVFEKNSNKHFTIMSSTPFILR